MDNEPIEVNMEPAVSKSTRKRPKLVWVISIFYILSAGISILMVVLLYSGVIPITEAQNAYFDSQNIFDHAVALITGSLNFLGAIFLFLLMRYAYYCFLTAFSLGIVMYVYQIIFKNWLGAMPGTGLAGNIIGFLISIAILLYSKKLFKNGILV
jgi:hypothetical protein